MTDETKIKKSRRDYCESGLKSSGLKSGGQLCVAVQKYLNSSPNKIIGKEVPSQNKK